MNAYAVSHTARFMCHYSCKNYSFRPMGNNGKNQSAMLRILPVCSLKRFFTDLHSSLY